MGGCLADACRYKCNVDYATMEQLSSGLNPPVELKNYFK